MDIDSDVATPHTQSLASLLKRRPDAGELSAPIKRLLIGNFDSTFRYLKAHKVLLRSRSIQSQKVAAADLSAWLVTAPLSGKQKAIFRRHLAVCMRFQELFDKVNAEAETIGPWAIDGRELITRVLCYLEEFSMERDEDRERINAAIVDPIKALEQHDLLEKEMHRYSAAALHILRHSNGLEPWGNPEDPHKTIHALFGLAIVNDTIQELLDLYAFTGYRAEVKGKDLFCQPKYDQFDNAARWASRRIVERRSHRPSQLPYQRCRSRTCEPVEHPFAPGTFDEFLNSQSGKEVFEQTAAEGTFYKNEIRADIDDVFDVNRSLVTRSGKFTIGEPVSAWGITFRLAVCARYWNRQLNGNGKWTLPVVKKSTVAALFATEFRSNPELPDTLLRQLSTSGGEHVDLFFKPLLQYSGEDVVVSPAFIEGSSVSRNVFVTAIQEAALDLSERGSKPLRAAEVALRTAGFPTAVNLPLEHGELRTDVDLAFVLDDELFVGQCKVVMEPHGAYGWWKAQDRLLHAATQLSRTLELLSSEAQVRELVARIPDCNAGQIRTKVPFIITNIWDFTGTRMAGFPVIDFDYLKMLLRGGVATITGPQAGIVLKLISGDRPQRYEFAKLSASVTQYSRPSCEHHFPLRASASHAPCVP